MRIKAEKCRQLELARWDIEIMELEAMTALYPVNSFSAERLEVAIRLAEFKRAVVVASPRWFWWLLDAMREYFTQLDKVFKTLTINK